MLPLLCLSVALLSACAPAALTGLPDQSLALAAAAVLSVDLPHGRLELRGGGAPGEVLLSGSSDAPLEIASGEGGLRIAASGRADLRLVVPDGLTLRVTSFDGEITLTDLRGDLRVDAVSGMISGWRLLGTVVLRSGRGDVTLAESSGDLTVLGEHGLLSLLDLHGRVASNTIMGTIHYEGMPGEGDEIVLEIDHGPVQVWLLPGTSLRVEAYSASGAVVCLAEGLRVDLRDCGGTVGAGDATLRVRTVSGAITIRDREPVMEGENQ